MAVPKDEKMRSRVCWVEQTGNEVVNDARRSLNDNVMVRVITEGENGVTMARKLAQR